MFKLKNVLAIIFGAGIFSFGIHYLVIPFHLYEGGATGLTLIAYYLFKIPVSTTNLIINIPLFIVRLANPLSQHSRDLLRVCLAQNF